VHLGRAHGSVCCVLHDSFVHVTLLMHMAEIYSFKAGAHDIVGTRPPWRA